MEAIDFLKQIDDNSVDMVLCDLPYGQTRNKWDSIIPLDKLWGRYKRIIKENGAIVLFGQGMFTAEVMQSNREMWRYNLIWVKGKRASGFLNANRMPLRNHEDIMIFYKKLPTYNPQMRKGKPTHKRGKLTETNHNYGKFKPLPTRDYGDKKFPLSVLNFERPHPPIHPTQKPVALFEYLIKTYTNEGELVLDNSMGSGTTAIACKRTGRNFIGCDIEQKYVDVANKRLKECL